jgi:hypothetical protein
VWDRPYCRWKIWIFHCVFGFWGDLWHVGYKKRKNWMTDLLLLSKRWEWRTASGGNLLAILWLTSHTSHNKYEVSNFYLCHSLYTQNKVHNFFFNKRDKISSLGFEGQLTTHGTEGIRTILTYPWHDQKTKNTVLFTQNHSQKRTHNTCNLSQRSPAHHQQCSVPQAELTVSFMSHGVSTCLSLHSLSLCDWAHRPTVFVMAEFSWPHYF